MTSSNTNSQQISTASSSREHFDVAVIGGGPAGIAAAIAAARMDRSAVLIEKHPIPGGMGTAALVSNFCNAHWDSKRIIIGGIFAELRDRLIASDAIHVTGGLEPYDPQALVQEVNHMCLGAGVDVYLNTAVKDIAFEQGKPAAITLKGRPGFTASTLVDASGDAMVAHQAGVPTTFGRAGDHAVMPLTYCYIIGPVDVAKLKEEMPEAIMTDKRTCDPYIYLGFEPRAKAWVAQARAAGELTIPRDRIAVAFSLPKRPNHVAVNFGRVFVDDPTDPVQLANAQEAGKLQVHEGVRFFRKYVPGFKDIKLVELAKQIGVRESRQIVGRYTLTGNDVLDCRQFDDVIVQCCYSIDVHEPGSDKTTLKSIPRGSHYDIPWRCLLPQQGQGPDNLIVAGRSISGTNVAMSSFRVTPSVMAIGEAAGIGAALASASHEGNLRAVAYEQVQQRLLETSGILV